MKAADALPCCFQDLGSLLSFFLLLAAQLSTLQELRASPLSASQFSRWQNRGNNFTAQGCCQELETAHTKS